MSLNDKPKIVVEQQEEDNITRKLLAWVNTYPDKPVSFIDYEQLDAKTTSMAFSAIPGTYILAQYITGGHRAEYQFDIFYRISAGSSPDRRLKAEEALNAFGSWAMHNPPDLGEGIIVIKIYKTTRAALEQVYNDQYEDHKISLNLQYEVI